MGHQSRGSSLRTMQYSKFSSTLSHRRTQLKTKHFSPQRRPAITVTTYSLRRCMVATGVARGCTGCTCTPRAEKNGGDLQGKVVSAPPGRACTPRQSKSLLLGNWGDLDGGSG